MLAAEMLAGHEDVSSHELAEVLKSGLVRCDLVHWRGPNASLEHLIFQTRAHEEEQNKYLESTVVNFHDLCTR